MTATTPPYATMARARDAFDLARKAMFLARNVYHEALDEYTVACLATGGGELPKCYWCDVQGEQLALSICCARLGCYTCRHASTFGISNC